MPAEPQLEQSLSTLSVGNIVTVGIQLFRHQGSKYFVTSLLAHIWLSLSLFGVGVLMAIGGGIAFASSFQQPVWEMIVLTMVGILMIASPLLAYTSGRFMAMGGLICRQVFNQLLGREETPEQGREQLLPRLWTFFGASLVSMIAVLVACLGLAVVAYLLWLVFWPLLMILREDTFEASPLPFLSLWVVYLLLNLSLLLGIYYVTSRLWFFDVVLALEDGVNAWDAVQRSWQITRSQGFNVMTVLFIGGVLVLPLSAFANVVNYIVPLATLLMGIFLFPIWQAVKAIYYYELISRNEGFAYDLDRSLVQPRQWLRQFAIQTPEQIELDFALAGVGSRTFAWIVDGTILYLGLFLLWYLGAAIYFYLVLPGVAEAFGGAVVDDLNLWVVAIASLLSYFISNGYHIASETLWQGQTPGKWLAKIRVIQADGRPVTVREAAIRSLIGPIDLYFFCIGLILIVLSKSEKRLGDLAAGTLVIQNEKRQVTPQAAIALRFGQQAQATAQTLQSQVDLTAITADQYLLLRDFLGYRVTLTPSVRKQVTVRLASQLRQILAPSETSAGLNIPEEELLEATYVACRQSIYQAI